MTNNFSMTLFVACRDTEFHSIDYIPITLYGLTEQWLDVETSYIEVQANEPITRVQTIASYLLIDYFIS